MRGRDVDDDELKGKIGKMMSNINRSEFLKLFCMASLLLILSKIFE
jgi:hypothetical protein